MDKQEIQARIDAINNEMVQVKAHYSKLEGHLGEAQHWLLELGKKEAEAQKAENEEPSNVETIGEDAEQTA